VELEMKIVAWLLLVIICLMLSATGFGILLAVPIFIFGTITLMASGVSVPPKMGWLLIFGFIGSVVYYFG
jgi:hypothetical protein